jgi:hypothetical protein
LKLQLETRESRSVKMMGSLRAVWPDRVRIQTRVGAFWPVASVAVDGDSAFVSLPRLQGYWAGELTGDTESNPASLASHLLWLLCPVPLLDDLEDPILEDVDGGWSLRGVLAGSDPPLGLDLRFPEKHAEITRILIRDSTGQILLCADRMGRLEVGDAVLPSQVRLEVQEPFAGLDVWILRPRLDPDRPADLFRISRPAGTRWVAREDLLEMFRTAGEGR